MAIEFIKKLFCKNKKSDDSFLNDIRIKKQATLDYIEILKNNPFPDDHRERELAREKTKLKILDQVLKGEISEDEWINHYSGFYR